MNGRGGLLAAALAWAGLAALSVYGLVHDLQEDQSYETVGGLPVLRLGNTAESHACEPVDPAFAEELPELAGSGPRASQPCPPEWTGPVEIEGGSLRVVWIPHQALVLARQ